MLPSGHRRAPRANGRPLKVADNGATCGPLAQSSPRPSA
jgi:hypothetical protein